jgi:multicomponent Na+:H+ antiporter subunit D
MNTMTIAWIVLPFLLGFSIFLMPQLDRALAMLSAIASAVYALSLLINQSSLSLQLLDSFGVTLLIDPLSGYFILTNALVTAAVILYAWQTGKTAFFYGQLIRKNFCLSFCGVICN